MLHNAETQKWVREQGSYEERLAGLEEELALAQHVAGQLDDQKQENLMLKETIDRLRFEMDELRVSTRAGAEKSVSRQASVSRSLGAEIARGMKEAKWDSDEENEEESVGGETAIDEDDDDTESEDVVQTIITRKKKVRSS